MDHPLIFDTDLSDGALARFLKAAETALLYGTVEVTAATPGTLTLVSGQLVLPVDHNSAEEARAALVDLLFRLLENRAGRYRCHPLTGVAGADRLATVATSKVLMEAMIRRVSGGVRAGGNAPVPVDEPEAPVSRVEPAGAPRPKVVRPPVQAPVPDRAMLDAAARLFDSEPATGRGAGTDPGLPAATPVIHRPTVDPAHQPPTAPDPSPADQPEDHTPQVNADRPEDHTPQVNADRPEDHTSRSSAAGPATGVATPAGDEARVPPTARPAGPATPRADSQQAARQSLADRLREQGPGHQTAPPAPTDLSDRPPGATDQARSHPDLPVPHPVTEPVRPVGQVARLRRSDDPRPGDPPSGGGRQRRAADLRRSLGSEPPDQAGAPAPASVTGPAAAPVDPPGEPAHGQHRQPNRRSALRNLIRTLTS